MTDEDLGISEVAQLWGVQVMAWLEQNGCNFTWVGALVRQREDARAEIVRLRELLESQAKATEKGRFLIGPWIAERDEWKAKAEGAAAQALDLMDAIQEAGKVLGPSSVESLEARVERLIARAEKADAEVARMRALAEEAMAELKKLREELRKAR